MNSECCIWGRYAFPNSVAPFEHDDLRSTSYTGGGGPDPSYNSVADFNTDGYVDVVDLLVLVETR